VRTGAERTVVVVEDDEAIGRLLDRALTSNGYHTFWSRTGRGGLAVARREQAEVVLLDLGLPDADGVDVARRLRSDLPGLLLVMLTARGEEIDIVSGLDAGADDYLVKPFSPRELVARVRTLLRRNRRPAAPSPAADPAPGPGSAPAVAPAEADDALTVGTLRVDPVRHEVSVGGTPVVCTPGEFRILAAMAAEPDRVFTRQRLLAELHGFDKYISGRTVDVHVMHLRKKIEPAPRRPVRLLTVFGVGYKLTDPAKGARRASS
jgi:DNA-binding response OmpR family regulator